MHSGYDCEPSSLSFEFSTSNQDDQLCGANFLTRVQCIDPAVTDANSIIYHTTECIQAPTAVTEAPTKTPTQLPTGSPSMEPTAMQTTMSSE